MRKPATAFEKEVAIAASGRRKRSSFLMDEPVGQAKEFPSLNRKKDAFLFFCGTLSVLAGTSGALCALAFGMALVEGSDDVQRQLSQELPWQDRLLTLSNHFLRLTGVFCSALVIVTETEWRRVMQYCQFLEWWSARGLFQLYLAALLYTVVHTEKTDDFSRSVMLYRVVASGGMAFMGTFYIFAGVLCVGSLKHARQRKEEERLRALQDLEDLERRRLELRGLLSLGE